MEYNIQIPIQKNEACNCDFDHMDHKYNSWSISVGTQSVNTMMVRS